MAVSNISVCRIYVWKNAWDSFDFGRCRKAFNPHFHIEWSSRFYSNRSRKFQFSTKNVQMPCVYYLFISFFYLLHTNIQMNRLMHCIQLHHCITPRRNFFYFFLFRCVFQKSHIGKWQRTQQKVTASSVFFSFIYSEQIFYGVFKERENWGIFQLNADELQFYGAFATLFFLYKYFI